MRKPNFFIVGAPKCGTTALARYLGDHPAIFVTVPKEPQYFVRHVYARHESFKSKHWLRSQEAYLELYKDAGPEHVAVGEATCIYLQSQRAMEGVHAFNPQAKIIAMLRHPVELAHSWHLQEINEGEEVERDFATAWHLQELRAKGRALDHAPLRPSLLQYDRVASIGSQLERLLELFPRGQLQVILLEDLAEDPAAVYGDTLDFLGAPNDGRTEFPVVHPSRTYRSKRLRDIVNRPPKVIRRIVRGAKHALNLDSKRLGLREWIRAHAGKRPAAIPPALRAELIAHFEPEIAKVESLLGRSLPSWRR